ncbi:MAG: bifunctional UDP-sugar hydrolase/5'-nucleotidase [Verrucomicrobiota bacterium]
MNPPATALGRRRFLRLLGKGTLLAALPVPLWGEGEDAETVTISVLHTTDLHGHVLPTCDYAGRPDLGGLARCATQLRQWRGENPNALLLDIGDVYQGTEFGLRTRGATMMRCLDALGYDAWVVGNHEFDWGADAFAAAVGASTMPVLSANARLGGRPSGSGTGPLANIRPCLVREIAGIRLAVIGLTTPGLGAWIPPENLGPFEVLDPLESLQALVRELAAQPPDAILLAGHMGLKARDDFANQVGRLTRRCPQIVAFLGGHTHQDRPSVMINGVLYTQADHFGIHAGRLDLTFDRATRRLVARRAMTVPMDASVALDPLVLSLAQGELDAADRVLAQPIGELKEPFGVRSTFGQPSDVERLIASGMSAALRKRGVTVDAVLHGLFENPRTLVPGPKTVADAWTILPYENGIVTAELSYGDLLAVARELGASTEARSLMGVRVAGGPAAGGGFRVDALQAADGAPLAANGTYRLACNAYDAQSAGQRFPVLARVVAQAGARRVLHPVSTRDALIDFFAERGQVSRAALLV